MNLTDVLRKVLVGRVIKVDTVAPRMCAPFRVEDVRIDSGGQLVIYPEGGSPIVFENLAEFSFTAETVKAVEAPKGPKASTRTIAALTVTDLEESKKKAK